MTESIVNSKIIISKSHEELSEHFARILIGGIKKRNDYFNIALSGGSTPKLLNKYLAEKFRFGISWEKIKFFWSDERCVPPDDPESNFKMSNETLLSAVGVPRENIFRIHGENDPEKEPARYSEILKHNIPSFNDLLEFDLVMLGLGEDGHTASIFGDSISLFEKKNLCAAAVHPLTRQKRITLTGTVINNARRVVFLVTGKSKMSVVDTIVNKKIGFDRLPASYVKPDHGELIWLLDDQAAALLKPF